MTKFLAEFGRPLLGTAIATAMIISLAACSNTKKMPFVLYKPSEPCAEAAWGHPDGSGSCTGADQLQREGYIYDNASGVWEKP